MNNHETYYEFSIDLLKSNLEIYCKLFQRMYQTIQEIDTKAVIIGYKAATTKNKHSIGIQAKYVLLNYTKAVPKHLIFIYEFFLNRHPNGKRIYSKFKILHNKDIDKIILAVKDDLIDYKFYTKYQPLQYHEIECIRWLYRYTDKADCIVLESYLIL